MARRPRGNQLHPTAAEQCVPCDPMQPNRSRIVELTKLARTVAGNLDKSGLKHYEYCVFGEIVQRMLHVKES